jgi:deoxycytidine triphosphate deaminase
MLGCGMLLNKARDENISGASYDLSLGDEYFYGGSIHQLSDSDPILLIEPYDYAIVTSDESSNLPNDICARFDLSVSLFCQGIILSNGPQIDPGFRGPMFCLLFNTSSSPVLLKRRQHYATLEFHKMMEPTYSYRGQYQAKNLLHYLPSNAARGAINELKKELEQVRKESQQLQNTTWAILALILALVAVWLTLK